MPKKSIKNDCGKRDPIWDFEKSESNSYFCRTMFYRGKDILEAAGYTQKCVNEWQQLLEYVRFSIQLAFEKPGSQNKYKSPKKAEILLEILMNAVHEFNEAFISNRNLKFYFRSSMYEKFDQNIYGERRKSDFMSIQPIPSKD